MWDKNALHIKPAAQQHATASQTRNTFVTALNCAYVAAVLLCILHIIMFRDKCLTLRSVILKDFCENWPYILICCFGVLACSTVLMLITFCPYRRSILIGNAVLTGLALIHCIIMYYKFFKKFDFQANLIIVLNSVGVLWCSFTLLVKYRMPPYASKVLPVMPAAGSKPAPTVSETAVDKVWLGKVM